MPKALSHSKSRKYFCSKTCQTKWRNQIYSGSNHPFWLGGLRTYRKVLRVSGKKMECRLCLSTEARVLAVHHLDKNRKNNALKNLIWLCHNCHFLIHHYDKELERLEKKL
jgi:hypothetical protein